METTFGKTDMSLKFIELRLLMSVLMLAFFPLMVSAQKVSERQALQKAQQFMKGKVFNVAGKARGTGGNTKASSALYVFNVEDNGGFVIVSGDERTDAILGYSTEGNIDFDVMPDNMRAWLKEYEKQINALPASANYSPAKVPTHPAVEPLVTAIWNQSSPYNLQCPEISGRHCLTGCVATAMAQIMYCHKWPQDYTASILGYFGYGTLDPVKFDWKNMKDDYVSRDPWAEPSTDEENNAVALLMHYCGQSVYMGYGLDESGSNSADVVPALINCFGYDNRAIMVYRTHFSMTEWDNLIYNELREGRPVFYDGLQSDGACGHAFVCDGYDGDGLYHINWGWGGVDDGYYKLSILDPSLPLFNYSACQDAIIGIQPPAHGDVGVDLPIKATVSSEDRFNYDYFFFLLYFENLGYDRVVDLGFCIDGADGTPVTGMIPIWENVELKRGSSFNNGRDQYLYLKDYMNLPNGSYRLHPVWRNHLETEYHKYREGKTDYLEFTIKDGTSSYGREVEVIRHDGWDTDVVCSVTPTGYLIAKNQPVVFNVSCKNNGDEEFASDVCLLVSKSETDVPSDIGNSVCWGRIEVEKGCETTITLQHIFSEAGTYYVWLGEVKNLGLTQRLKKFLCKTSVTVSNPVSLTPTLQYSDTKDWSTPSLTVKVNNYGSDVYDREIGVFISDRQYDASNLTEGKLYKSEKLFVEPGGEVTTTIPIDPLDIDRFNRVSLMYHINPNTDVMYPFSHNNIKPWQIYGKVFYVDYVCYWVVDTKSNLAIAFGFSDYTDFSSGILTYPSEVTNPNDGKVYKVKSIGNEYGLRKTIKNVIVSEGITTIQRATLRSETLETVTLPASLRQIEASAIGGPNLKAVYCKATVPPVIVDANGRSQLLISGDENDVTKYPQTLYVPTGCKAIYAKEWPKFGNIVEMEFKPEITVSVEDMTVGEGTMVEDLRFKLTFDGFLDGDDENTAFTTMPVAITAAKNDSPVGTYPITVSGGSSEKYDIIYKPGTLTIKPSIINFADPNVKAICVANWDSNHDGELSEIEASAVNSLGEVFQRKSKINIFNELRFFTGLTSIGVGAFSGCGSLASLTIPNTVTSIGYSAFSGCSSLASLTIPNSVTSIANYAFFDCSGLASVIIGNSVTSIGDLAFYNCSGLASVTIGNSVMSIGASAFEGCGSLTSIAIPNSVTDIGAGAFYSCSGLTSFTIPQSVTSLGDLAFGGCDNLKEIRSKINEPMAINYNVFPDYSVPLYVPKGTKAKYQTTESWKYFLNIVEVESLPGDLNSDGEVDVTDVVELIDMVLAGIYDAVGDINGDGEVDVTDVVELIDMVLNGE